METRLGPNKRNAFGAWLIGGEGVLSDIFATRTYIMDLTMAIYNMTSFVHHSSSSVIDIPNNHFAFFNLVARIWRHAIARLEQGKKLSLYRFIWKYDATIHVTWFFILGI